MGIILFSAVIAVFGLNPVFGHGGDRVYPFYEIPDEAAIDVTDGSIEDWEELFGEPSLTSLDFTGFDPDDWVMGYNPSDLDFRIYLGWSGTSNRIYVGAVCIDDVYVGEDEKSSTYMDRGGEDHLALEVDGDHDGSPYWDKSVARRDDKGDNSGLMDQGAQLYGAVPLRRETSHVGLPALERWWDENWWGYPPYGDGGGSVLGESPVVWVTEFFVTPFDLLIRREPENSVVSDLAAGRIVGFQVYVGDFDEPATHGPGSNNAREYYMIGHYNEGRFRDHVVLMDGILLPASGIDGGGSAVKPDSWARIKASFSQ